MILASHTRHNSLLDETPKYFWPLPQSYWQHLYAELCCHAKFIDPPSGFLLLMLLCVFSKDLFTEQQLILLMGEAL